MEIFNIEKEKSDIKQASPLVWAYIGDAVFELFVRTELVNIKNAKPNKLHLESIKIVSAKAQKEILEKINKYLTEEEKEIVRKGRNVKPKTMAKNASVSEYIYATGFEALIGYLYLNKEDERLEEIFEIIKKEIFKSDKT